MIFGLISLQVYFIGLDLIDFTTYTTKKKNGKIREKKRGKKTTTKKRGLAACSHPSPVQGDENRDLRNSRKASSQGVDIFRLVELLDSLVCGLRVVSIPGLKLLDLNMDFSVKKTEMIEKKKKKKMKNEREEKEGIQRMRYRPILYVMQ